MLAMIWFSSAVIAREPTDSSTSQNLHCCFTIVSLRASPYNLYHHLPSLSLSPSFIPPLFPCSYSLFYCHDWKLSHNFLTALFKGHPPPLSLSLSGSLCAPRPLSSSPFWEAPHPTRPALHSTGGGSTFKRCTSIADHHSQRHAGRLSPDLSCHQASAQGSSPAKEDFDWGEIAM